jgi:hypothetical protein
VTDPYGRTLDFLDRDKMIMYDKFTLHKTDDFLTSPIV